MTADAPGRVGRRIGATGAFGTGTYRAPRRGAPRDFGPFDAADLDPAYPDPPGLVDFGAVRVPVPFEGTVSVEPTADGRLQAVHVTLPGGRLSVSALAAPKSTELWPELVAEIDSSLRDGGARVRSFQGEWGRELHARTGAANSVFIGVDGARWMLYGVATGPAQHAVDLEAALREMLKGAVVDRGRSPYPVRTVLPLVVPEYLAGDHLVEDTPLSVPGPPAARSAPTRAPVARPVPAAEPRFPVAPSDQRPVRPVEPPRAVPVPPRAVPAPPRVEPAAPRVAAEDTQALPITPRVVARAAAVPVRADRPRALPTVAPPAPLWAAAPGPVTAADLGPDPADEIPTGRPVNDVVTPTEWWPVPGGSVPGGSVPGGSVRAEPSVPPTERWPEVPAPPSSAPVASDREPDDWAAAYRTAEPAATPSERWVPSVETEAAWSSGEPWSAASDPDGLAPRPDQWTPGHAPAELGPGPIELAAAAAVAQAQAPTTDWWPVVRPSELEPTPADRFRSGEGRSRRAAEPDAPRRRRRAPEPAAEPPPTSPRSGRRRAPEFAPSGFEEQVPEAPVARSNGHRASTAGPTEARLADDSLDLAALVRARSGRRRRARDEPEESTPLARTGRRRAPEPGTSSFPYAEPSDPATEPLPVVPGRSAGREPDRMLPVQREVGAHERSGPALAYPGTPTRADPGRPAPGRHHRPA